MKGEKTHAGEMATIGSLPPFDSKVQAWEEYCEIMEHFFTANDITDGDK